MLLGRNSLEIVTLLNFNAVPFSIKKKNSVWPSRKPRVGILVLWTAKQNHGFVLYRHLSSKVMANSNYWWTRQREASLRWHPPKSWNEELIPPGLRSTKDWTQSYTTNNIELPNNSSLDNLEELFLSEGFNRLATQRWVCLMIFHLVRPLGVMEEIYSSSPTNGTDSQWTRKQSNYEKV